jgi:hypothetical protein
MRAPPHAANFDGLLVSLTENQRIATLQAPQKDGTNPRDLEDWHEFQLQRFFMLGLDPDTYSAVTWTTS